jgi:hypothetical protein
VVASQSITRPGNAGDRTITPTCDHFPPIAHLIMLEKKLAPEKSTRSPVFRSLRTSA